MPKYLGGEVEDDLTAPEVARGGPEEGKENVLATLARTKVEDTGVGAVGGDGVVGDLGDVGDGAVQLNTGGDGAVGKHGGEGEVLLGVAEMGIGR